MIPGHEAFGSDFEQDTLARHLLLDVFWQQFHVRKRAARDRVGLNHRSDGLIQVP